MEKDFYIKLQLFKDIDVDVIIEKLDEVIEQLNEEFDCEANYEIKEE